jgi:TetR/AcrR family transcriptional regulator, transcriptional repressor of bet genes
MPKIVDAEDRRAALAAAAARLISTVGLENVRLKDVAADAGWTTGALTHYFPDKRALLVMAMTTSLDQLQGRKETIVAQDEDELRWLLEQALPLDDARRQHWRVSQALTVQSWGDEELTQIRVKAYRRWRRRIITLFTERQASGEFVADIDPEDLADETIAIVDGVATQALYDPDRWHPERQLMFLDRHLARLTA